MTLNKINSIFSFYSTPRKLLVLVFPLFVYSNEFIKLFNLYNKYEFVQYINTVFNQLNWKVLPNGLIVLVDKNIKRIYIKGEMYEGIVAYFDLHQEIYRLQNSKILEISSILFNNDIDKDLFMNEFFVDCQYDRNYLF